MLQSTPVRTRIHASEVNIYALMDPVQHTSLDLQVVQDYNANDAVHGILVQLPLPKHINEQRILDAISLEKDVDGFHPFNIGSLAMRGREPLYTSCTPKVGSSNGCLCNASVMRGFADTLGAAFGAIMLSSA